MSPPDAAAPWEPVQRATLSAEVADRVIAHVLDGTFALGERLPPERELAERLQVARSTVREALSALSVIGVVEVRPGAGAFVVSRHADFVARAFSWSMLLGGRDARDLVDARIAIECELARLAATRAGDQQLAAIGALARDAAQARDADAFARIDLDFHAAIAAAADSPPLERAFAAIRHLVARWIEQAGSDRAERRAAADQHLAIAAALRARDPERSAAAMRAHLEHVGQVFVAAAHDATGAVSEPAPAPRPR